MVEINRSYMARIRMPIFLSFCFLFAWCCLIIICTLMGLNSGAESIESIVTSCEHRLNQSKSSRLLTNSLFKIEDVYGWHNRVIHLLLDTPGRFNHGMLCIYRAYAFDIWWYSSSPARSLVWTDSTTGETKDWTEYPSDYYIKLQNDDNNEIVLPLDQPRALSKNMTERWYNETIQCVFSLFP